jgi:hypothetical protein
MEDEDDCDPQDEQAIRDRIDDEIVNRDLLERLDAGSRPHPEGRLTSRQATSGGSLICKAATSSYCPQNAAWRESV